MTVPYLISLVSVALLGLLVGAGLGAWAITAWALKAQRRNQQQATDALAKLTESLQQTRAELQRSKPTITTN